MILISSMVNRCAFPPCPHFRTAAERFPDEKNNIYVGALAFTSFYRVCLGRPFMFL